MTRVYFHGNCQCRSMMRMLAETGGDIEVRGREVQSIALPGDIDAFCQDIAWADIVVSQPISDDYRGEKRLSLRWIREAAPHARIVVFPSLFLRAYTPQVFYLRPLEAHAMPYHDAHMVAGFAAGHRAAYVAAQADRPGFLPATLVERQLQTALQSLRLREQAGCDVVVTDLLEAHHRERLLFHTPNHPGRWLLWRVLDRVLAAVGIAARPAPDGTDYLGSLTIPPYRSVVDALSLQQSDEFADLGGYSRFRLGERILDRRQYAEELWEFYRQTTSPAALGQRLSEDVNAAGYLKAYREAKGLPPPPVVAKPAHSQARPALAVTPVQPAPEGKRNIGPSSRVTQLAFVQTRDEFLKRDQVRWTVVPPRPRLAPAPIVDRNADLSYFLTKTHHAHQVGLWAYPSGTLSRLRGRAVLFAERAEGCIFDGRDFHYASGWVDAAPKLPGEVIERVGREYYVNPAALAGQKASLGHYMLGFDGNWRSYYHWLIDAVTRLFVLRQACPGRIVMPAPRDRLSGFHLESLHCLGIGDDEMVFPDPARSFERYEYLTFMHWNPTPFGGLGMLAELGAAYRAGLATPPAPAHRKIYVAREGARRSVANAEEITELMRGLGFEIVVPDRLSLRQQIAIFAEASWIVGPHGAGMTNMLFAPPGATVVEFMPDAIARPHFWGMATSLGHRYAVMVCPAASYFHDIEVDAGRLDAFLANLMAA